MSKNTVSFVATKYKDKPVNVAFYTKSGQRVNFTATEKAPVKEVVRFKTKGK